MNMFAPYRSTYLPLKTTTLLLLIAVSALGGEADISDPTYLLELASVHLKHDAIQRAQPLIHKALELSKDAAQRDAAVQSLKPVFQRTGNWKEAIATYEDLLPLALDAAERSKMKLALADADIKANDPDKGEALLVELARPDKERRDDDAHRQNALNALVQFWEANPKRVDAAIALADAELNKDDKDTAALERLIRIYSFVKPDLFRQIQYAEKLCALKPDDAGEQRRLAGLYLQDRKYDKAIEVNKRLMAAATSHEDAQNYARQVGNILIQSGKKDDAVIWMHDNFEAKITRSGDYVILATFYENAGLPQLAEASFHKWIEAASTPDEKIEGYFRIAQLALREKNFTHAEETLRTLAQDYKGRTDVQSRVKALFQRVEDAKQKAAVPPPVIEPPKGWKKQDEGL